MTDTELAQVRGTLAKIAQLKPEHFGLGYRPNFKIAGKPKQEPKPLPLRRFYSAGLGCGVSMLCLTGWASLTLYLVNT